MSAALVGFIGVIVGLAVGFGYRFWAARRSELADAVIAAFILSEELRAVAAGQPGVRDADRRRIHEAWSAQCSALIPYMSPPDLRMLAESLRCDESAGAGFTVSELVQRLDLITNLFWREHQAFILTPFLHYLTGDTVSKRICAALDPDREIPAHLQHGTFRTRLERWHLPPPRSRDV